MSPRPLAEGVDNHCIAECHYHQGKAEGRGSQNQIVPLDGREVI